MRPTLTVALPARNESRLIGACLAALDRAVVAAGLPVTTVVFANNCSDDTAARARRFLPSPGHVVEVWTGTVEPGSAGMARAIAIDLARARHPTLGVLTTDADGQMHPAAVARMAAALATADVACGRSWFRGAGLFATAEETEYSELLHDLRHRIDVMAGRQPADARPHYIESGACIAIRTGTLAAIGGPPRLPSSEDRALVAAAERAGARIRYVDARVRVSGRLIGRAEDGMAACLRARRTDPDPWVDQGLIRVDVLRVLWQQACRPPALPFPSRALPCGPRMRISELRAELPRLRALLADLGDEGLVAGPLPDPVAHVA
ncbi:glycosyltransferase [Frigidibacter oleivorans]|uniref:glycosyltransferase n=1 Tax=Frigidibacter oleivorans TaxID=2487129 RepID=UPI0013E01149|nr:glycosyltransferase [Frigidibacter oleivorans]